MIQRQQTLKERLGLTRMVALPIRNCEGKYELVEIETDIEQESERIKAEPKNGTKTKNY